MLDIIKQDQTWTSRIDEAAASSLAWLDAQAGFVADQPDAMRLDAAHDPEASPGMLLPATYNGILCRSLLGGLDGWDAQRRRRLAGWIRGFQAPTGAFRVPGMRDDNVFKKPDLGETWRYIDFHVTNYALGALEALGEEPEFPALARPFLEPQHLKAWLGDRDLRDPWQEGNNIVNLGSFLLLGLRRSEGEERKRIEAALAILFDWHDRNQDPSTGFWGVGQGLGGRWLEHAMAGSMHNFHLYYACGRPLPFQREAAACILARSTAWHSACIDVDEIDLLVHALDDHPELRPAGEAWLRRKLTSLLENQHEDGGIADTFEAGGRQDGGTGGHVAGPGASTTVATWFRWIAIAMIDDALWPGRRKWHFRRMIGIGYRRPRGIASHG